MNEVHSTVDESRLIQKLIDLETFHFSNCDLLINENFPCLLLFLSEKFKSSQDCLNKLKSVLTALLKSSRALETLTARNFVKRFDYFIKSGGIIEIYHREKSRTEDISVVISKGIRSLYIGVLFGLRDFAESEQILDTLSSSNCRSWYLYAMISSLAILEPKTGSKKLDLCMLGLGGGVLLRFIDNFLNNKVNVTMIVERNKKIVDISKNYFGTKSINILKEIEPNGKTTEFSNVYIGDAYEFAAMHKFPGIFSSSWDVVFVDIYSSAIQGVDSSKMAEFLMNLKKISLLVCMNIAIDDENTKLIFQRTFSDENFIFLSSSDKDDDNNIVYVGWLKNNPSSVISEIDHNSIDSWITRAHNWSKDYNLPIDLGFDILKKSLIFNDFTSVKKIKRSSTLFSAEIFHKGDVKALDYFKKYQYVYIKNFSPVDRSNNFQVFNSILKFIETYPKLLEAFQTENVGNSSESLELVHSNTFTSNIDQLHLGSWYCSAILQTDPASKDKILLDNFINSLPMICPFDKLNDTGILYDNALWLFLGKIDSRFSKRLLGRREHTDSVDCSGTWHYQLLGKKIWRIRPDEENVEWYGSVPDLSEFDGGKIEIICEEGDVLIVNTKLWLHQTELEINSDEIYGSQSFSYARDFTFSFAPGK